MQRPGRNNADCQFFGILSHRAQKWVCFPQNHFQPSHIGGQGDEITGFQHAGVLEANVHQWGIDMEPEITIQSLLDKIKGEGFQEAEKISQRIPGPVRSSAM